MRLWLRQEDLNNLGPRSYAEVVDVYVTLARGTELVRPSGSRTAHRLHVYLKPVSSMRSNVDAKEAGPSFDKRDPSESHTCAHRRMVEDEHLPDGQKTGRLICVECGKVISAPSSPQMEI